MLSRIRTSIKSYASSLSSNKSTNSRYRLIRSEFDEKFYRENIPSLSSDVDAVQHFITEGWRMGLDPSPNFSTSFYLIENEDVMNAGFNPFLHYLTHGRSEGRLPKPSNHAALYAKNDYDFIGQYFDIGLYLDQLDKHQDKVDPIDHYLREGWRKGLDPSPNFNTKFYLDNNRDVRTLGINPFVHYIKFGRLEGRKGHKNDQSINFFTLNDEYIAVAKNFDKDHYLKQCKNIDERQIDPVAHFCASGWKKGYDPTRDFSTEFYLATNDDVRLSGKNPYYHYISAGLDEGRMPKLPAELASWSTNNWLNSTEVMSYIAPYFDIDYYKNAYRDMRDNENDCLLHYCIHGWKEGRRPNAWFDTDYYIRIYSGQLHDKINPLLHYVLWGKSQNFATFETKVKTPAKRSKYATTVKETDLTAVVRFRQEPGVRRLHEKSSLKNRPTDDICINWIIPDFLAGGGGHMTIFRMVRWLEFFGYECKIFVKDAGSDRSMEERERILLQYYQVCRAKLHFLTENKIFSPSDVLIATSWDTAYVVDAAQNSAGKFYFVQDYEPMFYARGSKSILAENTYKLDLACICASPWLENIMVNRYGRWARSFMLSADENYVQQDIGAKSGKIKIAFYAREHTTRRAVEIGLMALDELAKKTDNFHVEFFGTDKAFNLTSYSANNNGILPPEKLSRLYNECDIGVCFSATNYSLVPQEMMMCKLPVVEIDLESTHAIFPEGVVALAEPNPISIASKIHELVESKDMRHLTAENGYRWASQFSWQQSARDVESAILERLGISKAHELQNKPNHKDEVYVSVIMPSYNGGEMTRRVIDKLVAQKAPWKFEIIVVDSSSSDGTWDYLTNLGEKVRAVSIKKSEFQHGRTRNLAVSMARGKYVVVLTQDALPVDDYLLYNFAVVMDRFPNAAGAFGRHFPWPDASVFTKRDINNHFDVMKNGPLSISRFYNAELYRSENLAHRQYLHYFSDNNACLRKSVWDRIKYPEIDYGEDQAWADEIIKAGYQKIYVEKAQVFHSHDYNEIQTFERARTDAEFVITQGVWRGARAG
ncbi:rhamnosyltransferase WsaF family glycosyltransferase [Methylobacterium frigidaeris]|uniref:Glycosyltransferase 2-like domain-containing protein n=1 Tax=Methylobacterium frigidaeris TaxID=2038277 RepID=A0AA37H7K9_9HYPH|nr:glycosyltransferase [Methylobacterium frigidaeris]GJD60553.1 hypothetical protein MPEAHAMD_0691 [Methylobacterium frigidaeris]